MSLNSTATSPRAQQLLDVLPQTQCTRCGYPDCAAYANAIAAGEAPINQCPPGGAEGIARLAALTGQPAIPLNPDFGAEGPRSVMFIDENWCIGCTLCIKACPTDAILGANKRMHTIMEAHCTGCALCLPVCPVDCIEVEVATPGRSGWDAWDSASAASARERYAKRQRRMAREAQEHAQAMEAKAVAKLADLPAHSQLKDPQVLDQKKAMLESVLAKARARRAGHSAD